MPISAGSTPNTSTATSVTAVARTIGVPATPMTSVRGNCGGAYASSSLTSAAAVPRPSTPPATPSRPLSTTSCRTTSPYVAPSARRTDSSRARLEARSSNRLPTLTHAISSSRPTAATSTTRMGWMSPTTACLNVSTCAPS